MRVLDVIMCKETEREDENWDLVAAGDKVREVCVVYVHNGIKYIEQSLREVGVTGWWWW